MTIEKLEALRDSLAGCSTDEIPIRTDVVVELLTAAIESLKVDDATVWRDRAYKTEEALERAINRGGALQKQVDAINAKLLDWRTPCGDDRPYWVMKNELADELDSALHAALKEPQ